MFFLISLLYGEFMTPTLWQFVTVLIALPWVRTYGCARGAVKDRRPAVLVGPRAGRKLGPLLVLF